MERTWILAYRKNGKNGRRQPPNFYSENQVSKQQALLELKRRVENDLHGNEWMLFELVAGYTAKVELVEAKIEEPNGIPQPVDEVRAGVQIRDVDNMFFAAPAPVNFDDDYEDN